MLSSILLTVPLLVASATAGRHRGADHGRCLSDSQAQSLIDDYSYLLTQPKGPDFNKIANAIISDSFTLTSDSLNRLQGKPLGSVTYTSKQAFIAGQSNTPPAPVLQTLGSYHTCDQITWRWNGSTVDHKFLVKGIISMDVDVGKTQIYALYDEFNTPS